MNSLLSFHDGMPFPNVSLFVFCFLFRFFSAEFVIDLADNNSTFEKFKAVLGKNGAEFSVSLMPYLIFIFTDFSLKCLKHLKVFFCFLCLFLKFLVFSTFQVLSYLLFLEPHHSLVTIERTAFPT